MWVLFIGGTRSFPTFTALPSMMTVRSQRLRGQVCRIDSRDFELPGTTIEPPFFWLYPFPGVPFFRVIIRLDLYSVQNPISRVWNKNTFFSKQINNIRHRDQRPSTLSRLRKRVWTGRDTVSSVEIRRTGKPRPLQAKTSYSDTDRHSTEVNVNLSQGTVKETLQTAIPVPRGPRRYWGRLRPSALPSLM